MIPNIQEIIDEQLLAENAKPRVRSGKWNPSSFGMCYRQQYWNRKNESRSNPFDARNLRVFEAGKLFEQWVMNHLSGLEEQVLIEEDDVKGLADVVTEDTVLDVKSQHSKSFWYIKKCKDIVQAKYNNWLQVMYYAIQLNKKYAGLVIISKDDLCIWQHVLAVNDYWLDEVDGELYKLRSLWAKAELPPALPRCEHSFSKKTGECKYWHCTYCGWQDKCRDIEGDNWPPIKKEKELKKGE